MEALSSGEMALRVGAALVCGALVGLERERKHRPAGFRTMILISLGSCGFVLIGIEAVAHLSADALRQLPASVPTPGQAEISRVIQGLMGGIGFLGAGAVIQNKRAVRGLTTAAAVWVVSALGAACGLGMYKLGLMLGGATLFTLVILDLFENRFFPDPDDGAFTSGKKNGKHKSASESERGEPGEIDAGIGPSRLRGDEVEEVAPDTREWRGVRR